MLVAARLIKQPVLPTRRLYEQLRRGRSAAVFALQVLATRNAAALRLQSVRLAAAVDYSRQSLKPLHPIHPIHPIHPACFCLHRRLSFNRSRPPAQQTEMRAVLSVGLLLVAAIQRTRHGALVQSMS